MELSADEESRKCRYLQAFSREALVVYGQNYMQARSLRHGGRGAGSQQ